MSGILTLLGAIAPKLFDVIDSIVDNKETASKIKEALTSQMLDQRSDLAKAASNVVMSEIKGESWLQRNWRPLLMIWFSFLIGAYWFGFVPVNMPVSTVDKLFTLVQIGVGGYVVGRSGEKIAGIIAPAISKG